MAIFSLVCIIIAIIFINYSMYRGMSLPLACIIGTIFICITSGLDIQTTYQSAMDSSVAAMMVTYAPLFFFGGILGMFYSESGAITSLGEAILAPSRKIQNPAVKMMVTMLLFFVIRTLLSLAGIDGMAIMPTVCALAISVFKELDAPRKYLSAILQCGGTISMFLPFAPGGANIILPMLLPGFTPGTAWAWRLFFLALFAIGSVVWITKMIQKDQANGEHFEMGKMLPIPINESNYRPHWIVTLIPIALIVVLYNVFGMAAWLALAGGTALAAVMFFRYIPIPEGRGKLATIVDKCNNAGVMISVLLTFSYLPGIAITMSPAYDLVLSLANNIAVTLPLAVGFGILAVFLVIMGNSCTIVLCDLANNIFLPAGLALPTLSILMIVGNTVFDTLPNSPFLSAQAQMLDSPMPESYPPIFKTTVLMTSAMMVLAIILAACGIIG